MKREYLVILSLFLGILAYSCFNETSERGINEYNLNDVGKEFMERVMENPDWQVEWEKFEEFGRVEPNLAYMALGGGYGKHYILPILTENELNAIVIYPIDENDNMLKKPFVIDGSNINNNFTARSVLRSPVRGDWEKAGVKIRDNILPTKLFESQLLLSRGVEERCFYASYELFCQNYMDDKGFSVCNSMTAAGFSQLCRELYIKMRMPGQLFVDDFYIGFVMPAEGLDGIVENYFDALKTELFNRHCTIIYYFDWNPDSPMNADPGDFSWNINSGNNGGSAGGGAGNNSGDPSGMPIVDSTALESNPYINCVYKKVSTRSSTFRAYLERFRDENSIAHLKFDYSDDLGATVNGMLEYQMDKYWITIKLNEVRLMNATPLRLARTLIHEVIHANIFAKLMSLYPKLKPNLNTQEMMDLSEALDKQNFPSLYYYYERYVFDATAQHQYMAAYNVDVIAAVLQEMDPTASRDLRHALAWEGLKYIETRVNGIRKIVETEAWKTLSSTEKLRMTKAFEEYSKTAKNECED